MLSNCKILIAKTAGFCFGVDRAVKMVYNTINDVQKNAEKPDSCILVSTLGPIIHNSDVVSDLQSNGVFAINSPDDAKKGQTVVIRSHGVGNSVYDKLKEKGVSIIDATCPFVSRIHKIAYEQSSQGRFILIAGDKNHPEVKGIAGHCVGEYDIFCDEDELFEIYNKKIKSSSKSVAILAQTTYNIKLWEKCVQKARLYFADALIYDTICNATFERQSETMELASKADVMLIVGGRHSSNTIKLKAVCKDFCQCYLVENAKELYNINFSKVEFRKKVIGISAGASTPAYIIKEVQGTMTEILQNLDEEFNFEEALEQSFKKIYNGAKVRGYVTSVNNSEVIVDIGTKHTGYIPASELSDDSSVKPADVVKVGEEIDLIVTKISDQDGIVTLSKKRVDAMVGFETIRAAKEENAVLSGVVTNVIKGGILVLSHGLKVFIPASQATARRDDKLEDLLKKTVNFKVLEVNEGKGRALGSIRAVLKDQRDALETKFFETCEEGAVMTGTVKSITDYGVFVDLGGVDGLIRKPDLSWARVKHPSDVVSIGDTIEVTIKDIDKENHKVSLIYKKTSDNPWEMFKTNYEVGQEIQATVVSITAFGAFAQIVPGVDGLIHISQIANKRVSNVADILAVGDKVDVKITEIDTEKKRISLSMRALLTEEVAEEAAEEETTEEAE